MRNILEQKFYDLKTDVINLKNGIKIYAEVPGMDINDIKVDFIGKFLIIQGLKKKYYNYKKELYLDNSCPDGSFKKYIPIPSNIDPKKFDVFINKGILEIYVN